MDLLIASDLHFEFHRDLGLEFVKSLPEADVLVCAGDLANAQVLELSLGLLCTKFSKVVFVPGNHEFYESSFPAVRTTLQQAADRYSDRLHVLDNAVCEIQGVRFVGSTMWTPRTLGASLLQSRMGDFSVIENADPCIYEENDKALHFLKNEIQEGCDVVVTHHLPTKHSIDPAFKRSPLNCFFLCDVEDLIHQFQPKLWVHGHTHSNCDYLVEQTRVLCNPFGYAGHEQNPHFNPNLIVTI